MKGVDGLPEVLHLMYTIRWLTIRDDFFSFYACKLGYDHKGQQLISRRGIDSLSP